MMVEMTTIYGWFGTDKNFIQNDHSSNNIPPQKHFFYRAIIG
jgi:hypothetical protein